MFFCSVNTHGPIPFEELMRRALYDPQRGYYARQITGVGRHGDFTTAPMLSGALAKAIAAWATRSLTTSHCRDLIEIGPGDGTLATAVWASVPWHVRWRTRLHLVESSAPLAALQRKALGKHARWHTTAVAALAACGGRAVIFSNELVDAFPVRRFQHTPGAWRELAVAIDATGTVAESLLPPAPLPESSGFFHPHRPGQWIEVHQSYHRWLADWLPLWRAGRLLTIDYGAPAATLYQRQPQGSVRAYLFQQRLNGPLIYQNLGRQDLTADVNFTDLIEWSRPWTTANHLQSLAAFLRQSCDPADPTDHALTDEAGPGGAFMVLDQQCAAQPTPK